MLRESSGLYLAISEENIPKKISEGFPRALAEFRARAEKLEQRKKWPTHRLWLSSNAVAVESKKRRNFTFLPESLFRGRSSVKIALRSCGFASGWQTVRNASEANFASHQNQLGLVSPSRCF
jgi:hypothetical protein